MIDLSRERLLTLEAAADLLRVSQATVYRWIRSGTGGVRLEAAKVGAHWRTSEEAIQRFSDTLTGEDAVPSPVPERPRTAPQRQRASERAARQLDDMFGVRRCETCDEVIAPPPGGLPKDERLWCPRCIVKRRSATLEQRIRSFRWAELLSQLALSNQVGIRQDKIRAFEFDEKEPSEQELAKLIEVLGADLVSGMG
jgi:excisionase family DNA binding protein